MIENRKKHFIILLFIVSIMTIGFAVLSTNLTLNGITTVGANTWDVHFENIVLNPENNVTGTQSITNDTTISSSITLNEPGDYYSFIVDIVNEGSIDAMLNSIVKTTLTTEQEKLIDFNVTYADGITINQYDKLAKTSGIETIKIEIIYKKNITSSDLPSSPINLNLNILLDYIQATSSTQVVSHTDLGNFIIKAKRGAIEESDIGKTFSISLGSSSKNYLIRVVNVSNPMECSGNDFSQTACGVVLEFSDIITTYTMKDRHTNVGGWRDSNVRALLNYYIYYLLPTELQNSILNTKVVSGHGSNTGETNFITIDKLYLFNLREVWNSTSNGDTSNNYSRQLDYYAGLNVTTSSYSAAKKFYNGSSLEWWTRSAYSGPSLFYYANNNGSTSADTPRMNNGVSPAFRIA